MAYIQMNVMSEALMRTVQVNVILPADKIEMPDKKGIPVNFKDRDFKTLYLLHGVFGSQSDWINGTRIQRLAEEKNLAVVMPAGENHFYVDHAATWDYYGRFVGDELVRLTRRMFRLSDRREDTFIAGLSMGGYGALRNGLKYHDHFGCIAGLSAANMLKHPSEAMFFSSKAFMTSVFGDLEQAKNSDNSLDWLIEQRAASQTNDQKIYLCVGTEDPLQAQSIELRDHFSEKGFDVTYEEGPGGHEWDFWDRYIERVLNWLPLEEGSAGIGSGNVGL